MHGLRKVLLKQPLPILCYLLFLFLCLYRLPSTYAVNGDMARDSLQSLRILRSKEITFIGPPLSVGQLGTHVTYFSSAIYYLGALGLATSGFSVLAPIIMIAIINASAIFPLFQIMKSKSNDTFVQFLGLLIYVTNPIVVLYSRLFWNPSPLIGLGVWGTYFLGRSAILFAVIAAVSVYFHYFGVVFFIFGLVFYLKKKDYRNSLVMLSTWILVLSPFLLFEIKNKFYLTLSFIANATQGKSTLVSTWQEHTRFFLEMPIHVLGLMQDPFALRILTTGTAAMWIGLALWIFVGMNNRKNVAFYFIIVVAMLTALASTSYIRIQYFFVALGCISLLKGYGLVRVKKGFLVAIILLQSLNTVYAVTRPVHVAKNEAFLTISQLEDVSGYIIKTHKIGKSFNITENIRGDARAQYLRFFLEKNRLQDLKSELEYQHLDELYVLTPSLQKTFNENRWEFTAGGASELVDVYEIAQWKVLKFQKPKQIDD